MTAARASRAGQLALGLAVLAAVVAATVQVVEGPPGSGYGWGSVAISAALLVIPIVGMGLMAASGEPRYRWLTVVLAVLLIVVVLAALVGNWQGQPSRDRVLDAIVAVLVVAASAASVVAVSRTRR